MIPLTLPALQAHLTHLKLAPQLQKETGQLVVPIKIEQTEFPLFFRLYEGGELLQLMMFIPSHLKSGSVVELARLLHLINKELDLPGFCMDEKAGLIFYRAMLPATNREISGEVIEKFCGSIQTIAETFAPIVMAVAMGAATYEQILAKLHEQPDA